MSLQHNHHDVFCHQCKTTIDFEDFDYFEGSHENNKTMMFLCVHCSDGLDYCVDCGRTIDTLHRGIFIDGYEIDDGEYLCCLCEPDNENFVYEEDQDTEEEDDQDTMQEEFEENPENVSYVVTNKRCHECNTFVDEDDTFFVDHNNKKSMYFCEVCSQHIDQCEKCDAVVDMKRSGGEYLDGFIYEDGYGYNEIRCLHCAPNNQMII